MSAKGDDDKEDLYELLDSWIARKGLTDLHTHLMGMGSADFWVSRIMEMYLPRKLKADSNLKEYKKVGDVAYPLKTILEASGFAGATDFEKNLDRSVFEARFFDGFIEEKSNSLKAVFLPKGADHELYLENQTLIEMLKIEDNKYERHGPLRALVRNWFEFLGSSGHTAHHSEVLQTYRGNFSPGFYPQRFTMKDPIVNKYPEVLGILLNTTCARYARAGVYYTEYSMSVGDLLNEAKFSALIDKAFTESFHKAAAKKDPRLKGKGGKGNLKKRKRTESINSTSSAPQSDDGSPEASAIEAEVEAELQPDAAATAPMCKIVLPTMTGSTTGPTWRKYMNYVEKPRKQKYYFLAAFSRKPKNPVYHTIKSGIWTELALSPTTSKASYANFGEIASNLHEIRLFLQLENAGAAINLQQWNDVAATVGGAADGALFSSLCASGDICYYLQALAEVLCADKFLEQVYPDHLQEGKTKIPKLLGKVTGSGLNSILFMNAVVGCDWVGDELGHPFCIFSHDSFVGLIATWMQHNEDIGVRIHAGEGPIRPSTLDEPASKVRLAFYLHMYIVCESIKLYHSKLTKELVSRGSGAKKVNLRIGHGVAFLFGCYEVEPAGGATSNAQRADPFVMYLKNFRDNFLKKHNIVCELNPTSNHMLLPSTFHGGETLHNHRTLPTFLAQGLPVVLGTDDDGIWAIHKCKRHYHHVSVAAEYCQAIEDGEITSKQDLERMLTWGRKSAFVWSEEKDAAGATEVDTETDDMN